MKYVKYPPIFKQCNIYVRSYVYYFNRYSLPEIPPILCWIMQQGTQNVSIPIPYEYHILHSVTQAKLQAVTVTTTKQCVNFKIKCNNSNCMLLEQVAGTITTRKPLSPNILYSRSKHSLGVITLEVVSFT